ncbi:hypothetical protein E8E13_000357 [Curvularia kusanoi]|uniref:Uncharacterized protein n=1 Tax=Curvularia kusanoi TaxID=90978 RepID=A0A9P4T723_CURKU|nr:hypothetical protein E8E13_000357 [Curvularia kusanoi]
MSLKVFSLAAISLASMMASPAAAASPGLYLCQNWGFNNNPNFCYKYTVPWGRCTTITDRFPPGDRGVSSAGPDEHNWCTLYQNEGCTGPELQLRWPGYADLGQVGWNDRAKSFNCAFE